MSNILSLYLFITNAKQIQIIIPPPPPPTTKIIQQYNMPTIVYRASFIVRRRTSCTDNRRELFYAYNNQPSASYHLCPCSIDGIGGIGILITTIRRWVYDRRHITAIVGEAKCIIPLRNHSTIHKLMQTQQSTELHILIAAPPPL